MNEQLKQIRDAIGLTQGELAAIIGCNASNVGHYESGRATMPAKNAVKLLRLANRQGWDLSLDHIYGVKKLPELHRKTA